MGSLRPFVVLVALALVAAFGKPETKTRSIDPEGVATDDASRAEEFGHRLDELRRDVRIPGLAAVVLRGNKIILSQGWGEADIDTGRPVTPDTPFNIASLAKPIAAVVALRLVEKGKLDLEKPMSEYAGYAEYEAACKSQGGLFFGDYADGPPELTMRHVLSMQMNGAPGSKFFYNPVGYSWASRPMAEVGGKPFSELVRELVFEPAGMTRSARIHRKLPLSQTLSDDLALPHGVDADGQVRRSTPPEPQGDGAGGGVISTVNDLARFDVALAEQKLLTPASVQRMWTPGRSTSGVELPYGLGWYTKTLDGERLVWHTGLWEGRYSALYLKLPDRQLTVILLANSEGLTWEQRLDEAAVERSPFAAAFLNCFPE